MIVIKNHARGIISNYHISPEITYKIKEYKNGVKRYSWVKYPMVGVKVENNEDVLDKVIQIVKRKKQIIIRIGNQYLDSISNKTLYEQFINENFK